jgi:glycosyltransferase involved in cell wall biosynthesis
MRVVFLTNIISPYRLGVFENLAKTRGWDFHVLINARSEFDRQWEVDTAGLSVRLSATRTVRRTVVTQQPVRFEQVIELHLPTGLWGDLRALRPDVIISHEMGPRSAIAAAYARAHGIPLVIWAYQSRVSGGQSGMARKLWRRTLLGQAAAVVGMGVQARQVLRGWGVQDDRIIDAPNSADHVTLERELRAEHLSDKVAEIRESVGGRKIALVVGRLIPLKGIPEMLAAWEKLPQTARDEWRLVFVGHGPMDGVVRAHEHQGVVLAGSAKPREMAAWYVAADLHVFPSLGDVWGLVVNEASQCGTPSLCSVHAGCCDDLITAGVDGLTCDPANSEQFAAELAAALDHSDLPSVGLRARQTVSRCTQPRLADSFRRAVEMAVARAVA